MRCPVADKVLDPERLPPLLGPPAAHLYVQVGQDEAGHPHTHHTLVLFTRLGGVLEEHEWCSCQGR